ncbi:MAG: adenosylmethionine--8-amino-7-oxononanoate transaminase [Lentisphaeraceae bacterium]|nr:adenosylmethionine--8-amino-7-oxononanoate transaminase [Lentisphaeraceae bacterium]
MNRSLQERDLSALWHPCSQMKDYEDFPLVEVKGASGSLIQTDSGELIDVISSWWCKSLGHRHPEIISAVKKQLDSFEHVILANTTNEQIVSLCEKLLKLCPGYDKIFFCDSGSDSVEVAMKMALQYQLQIGQGSRTQFMSLENGYHGETILTLAAGDCGLYGKPFESIMPKVEKIKDIPYVKSYKDWPESKLTEDEWVLIETQLEKKKKVLAGIVLEPVLQGAGGMQFYKPDFLKRLKLWCEESGVLLIADEILTGMGRLGYARACEISGVVPDISVFSKGLTSGFSPLACALTTNKIYEAFYDDYETGRAFMHSNTYCGNAVGVAAANAALGIYQDSNIFERVRRDSQLLIDLFEEIAESTGALKNIRCQGFVVAAELTDKNGRGFDSNQRVGFKIYKESMKRGLLMRPLGNTLYFLPPLNTQEEILKRASAIAVESIRSVLN